MSEPIAAIEIGTSRTVIAVAETKAGGQVKMLGLAEEPSSGIRKSRIVNVQYAANAVAKALERIGEESGIGVCNAVIGVSGPLINTFTAAGTWQVGSRAITDDDVRESMDRAREQALHQLDGTRNEMIQVFDLDYSAGAQDGIEDPVGMSAQLLTHRVLTVNASREQLENTRNTLAKARVEVQDWAFTGYAAAIATLTPREMEEGALAIDLGGGSTAFTVFTNGRLVHAGVVGVGGDHVTSDIAQAFNISLRQAEALKISHGSAAIGGDDRRIELADPMPGGGKRTISHRALATVINARVEEIFRVVLDKIDSEGLLHRAGAGAVLTGGGAAMRGVEELAASTLGMHVRIGRPENVDWADIEMPAANAATITGLIMHCAECAQESEGAVSRFFRRFFAK